MFRVGTLRIAIALTLIAGAWCPAQAGRFRIEASGGVPVGDNDERDGDALLTVAADYEWNIFARTTLGLRGYPLFYYHQHFDDKDILGLGAGFVARVYQNKDLDGLFGELAVSGVGHTDYIAGNGSLFNFFSEAGVGYHLPGSGWHLLLKVQHLSNADLNDDNSATNTISLNAGYAF